VAKVHQGHGDKTPARDKGVAEHLRLTEGKVRPGEPRHGASHGQGLKADTVHLDADGVRRPGVGSGDPDREAEEKAQQSPRAGRRVSRIAFRRV
jgi:hypothetical protein